MADPVVHFEMGYFDRDRIKKFYSSTFGWQLHQMGDDMGGYVVAQTTETDKDGMVKTPGNINGGFYAKTDNPDSHAPSVVVSVKDINKAINDVKANGGKIKGSMTPDGKHTLEPQMIPGIGRWISCEDTEQNRFSLLQPSR